MPPPDTAAESPLREQWRSEEAAIDAILDFERLRGHGALRLAWHACFPLYIDPELVNLIHINFLDEGETPWLAEADLLLSPLCRPVGDGFYRVCPRSREVLLAYMLDEEPDGPRRLRRLADFLLAYLDRPGGAKPRADVLRARQWIAWSYLAPRRVVEEMETLLRDSTAGGAGAMAKQLEVAAMTEVVHTPLVSKLPESAYLDLFATTELLASYWYANRQLAGGLTTAGEEATAPRPLYQTVLNALEAEKDGQVGPDPDEDEDEEEASARPPNPNVLWWIDRPESGELVGALLGTVRPSRIGGGRRGSAKGPKKFSRRETASVPETIHILLRGRRGMGMTSLAARAARDATIRDRFPDGVLWVTVRSAADVPGELAAIASYFHADVGRIAGVEERAEMVRHLLDGRRCLLIVDAKDAPAAAGVLVDLPSQATLLITRDTEESRAYDGWASRVVTMGPIEESAIQEMLSRMVPRLDPSLLARAAALTQGVPVVMVLVAGALEQARSEGRDLEDLLGRREREAEAARGLDPVTYWDWTLLRDDSSLDDGERLSQHFLKLSAFAPHPAEFDVSAVGQVWKAPLEVATRDLQALVDRELLLLGSEPDWYALSPDQAAVGAAFLPPYDGARLDHAAFYFETVKENPDHTEWMARAFGQIERAWQTLPDDFPGLFEFMDRMKPFFEQPGREEITERWLNRALDVARWLSRRDQEASLLLELGRTFAKMGQLLRARSRLNEAIAVAQANNDPRTEGLASQAYAELLVDLGDLTNALDFSRRACSIFEQIGDAPALEKALRGLAWKLDRMGRQEAAHAVRRQSEELRLSLSVGGPSDDLLPPLDRARGQPWRVILDAEGRTEPTGRIARREAAPPTGDMAADETYDALEVVHRFFWSVYDRDSFDDHGAPLLAVVHYGSDYANAHWDGRQIVLGDGDGRLFRRFTQLDVIGRQFAHAMIASEAGLAREGEAGALESSLGDVIACLVTQYQEGQTADRASWLVGAGLFLPGVNARGIRSLAAPGTAYDDPQLGRDAQPEHMRDYVKTGDDRGGVHINSGIPNHAFYRLATALGGFAWDRAGRIWYETVRDPRLKARSTFQDFARLTWENARSRFGQESEEARGCVAAWEAVGIIGIEGPPLTGTPHARPRGKASRSRRRSHTE